MSAVTTKTKQSPNNLAQRIEALVFASAEAVSFAALARELGVDKKTIATAVEALRQAMAAQQRGVVLLVVQDTVTMTTAPEVAGAVEAFIKNELQANLTRAALETLAIIAYRGPVTRGAIDAIRGVNSSVMLRTLLLRGLIDRKKKTDDSRMFEYVATPDFFKHLGVTRKEDLPDFMEIAQHPVLNKMAADGEKSEMKDEASAQPT